MRNPCNKVLARLEMVCVFVRVTGGSGGGYTPCYLRIVNTLFVMQAKVAIDYRLASADVWQCVILASIVVMLASSVSLGDICKETLFTLCSFFFSKLNT